MDRKNRAVFTRYSGNPIITSNDLPYPANSVFNPGAVFFNNKTLLLMRVEDLRGFSHLTKAISEDGLTNWKIDPHPTLQPDPNYQEEQFGLEDPRIVFLEELGKYAITYVSFSRGGPVVSIALTEDFCNFERLGCIMPPEDKDASLFPRKVKGRYVLIHRPIIRGEAHVWISFSPDLKYWGDHRILIPVRPGWWDNHRVGLGPPPIETSEGWLILYHGVRITASGSLYRVGIVLLDLDDPTKIVYRSDRWVFGPEEELDFVGDVPGVTFPTGLLYDRHNDRLIMYYGAADKYIAVAMTSFSRIRDLMKEEATQL
ncbi:MAG: glycosidase [Syntrophales bacterium]|nr:glycosidase [Syntrophales bacterium]